MPRGGKRPGTGGARPGAGRPRKAPAAAPRAPSAAPRPAANSSPLQHLLDVMNDPNASTARRDRAAIAAAPYVHGKVGEKGKKERKDETAREVAGGGRFSAAKPPRSVN